MARQLELSRYPTDRAERIAKIIGASSAVASALAEMNKRNAAGEKVSLWIAGAMIFVLPDDAGPAVAKEE